MCTSKINAYQLYSAALFKNCLKALMKRKFSNIHWDKMTLFVPRN